MQRAAPILSIVLAAIALCSLHLYGSFGLVGNARIAAYNSGIFDMDADRVIFDWATSERGLRTPVHPLAKLVMAPIVAAVRGLGGRWQLPLHAVLLVIAVSMTINTLLCGLLAHQLTRGQLLPAVVAAVWVACSFSSVLLGSIPETASVSALSTVVPLVYLNRRRKCPFSWGEAAVWGVIGVFCIAFTITQVVHWLIALLLRGYLARASLPLESWRAAAGELRRELRGWLAQAPWPRVAASVLLFALLTAGLALWQQQRYEGTPVFFTDAGIAHERHYMRFDAIVSEPAAHAGRLLSQVFLYDFAAPRPGFSSLLSFINEAPWWSISLEETAPRRWWWHQYPLLLLVGLAVGLGVYGLGRPDALLLAPLLAVASQVVLHAAYGREYVLYSGNFHGVLVALLVASVFRRLPDRSRLCAGIATLLALAMLANNLMVMRWVYAQVAAGLEASARTLDGELLPRPPDGFRPKGARSWPPGVPPPLRTDSSPRRPRVDSAGATGAGWAVPRRGVNRGDGAAAGQGGVGDRGGGGDRPRHRVDLRP